MLQVGDVIVSFDVLKEKFLCDLSACRGACCIEGDAGAPLELDEVEKIEELLPLIWDELSPEAREIIDKQGVAYVDPEGDLVTSIVGGKDCVFTCYDEKGCCYCAIESLSHPREGLRHLQGGELQPLGRLQGGGLAGAEGEPARLQVPEGAAHTQVRRGVV